MNTLEKNTKEEIKELNNNMKQMDNNTKAALEKLDKNTKEEIKELRNNTNEKFNELSKNMKEIDKTLYIIYGGLLSSGAIHNPGKTPMSLPGADFDANKNAFEHKSNTSLKQ